jgi:Protein of unknown function (DUF2846)
MKKSILLLIATSVLFGCTAAPIPLVTSMQLTSPAKATNNGDTIYVFRGESTNMSPFSLSIYLDGVFVGTLKRKNYLAFKASPGQHIIKTDCHFPCDYKLNISLNLENNKVYYFSSELAVSLSGGFVSASKYMVQIDKSKAQSYLKLYGLQDTSIQ